MLSILEETEKRENAVLEKMTELFRQVDETIPSLPSTDQTEITSQQQAAQEKIKDAIFVTYQELLRNYYHGDLNPADQPGLIVPIINKLLAQQANKHELVKKGLLTEDQSKAFTMRQNERQVRLRSYADYLGNLMGTHGGQIFWEPKT